jgi:hypothetical protein
MEKRKHRQRLQRIQVVRPDESDWEVIDVQLDAYTLVRLDALTARVRAGDIPASFAKHLSTAGSVQVEAPQPTKSTAVKKIVLATLATILMSGCIAPLDMDDLFDGDATPPAAPTAKPDAGKDAAPVVPPVTPAVVPDAGTMEQPGNDTCWPASAIVAPDAGTYEVCTSQGMVAVICPNDTGLADNCTAPIPWEGSVTIQWSQPRCCK